MNQRCQTKAILKHSFHGFRITGRNSKSQSAEVIFHGEGESMEMAKAAVLGVAELAVAKMLWSRKRTKGAALWMVKLTVP